ncbi:MAG: hypothetical protein ACLS5X_00690 [Eubacterium sp.]
MKIKDIEFENNIFLAPWQNCDRAFRELALTTAGYTVTEMVSSKGLTMGDKAKNFNTRRN